MKTLYINLNGETIESSNNIVVVGTEKDNIVNKFYIALGTEICDGVIVKGVKKKQIVAEFESEYPQDFKPILDQWDEIRYKLLSSDPSGIYSVKIPNSYLEWLQYHQNAEYRKIYTQKYSQQKDLSVNLDMKQLYDDAIELIISNIEPGDYNKLVVNDEFATSKSKVVKSIKSEYPKITFILFEEWEMKEDKCPKCGKNPCECDKESPVCPKCGKNPCECGKAIDDCLFMAYKERCDYGGNYKVVQLVSSTHKKAICKFKNDYGLEVRIEIESGRNVPYVKDWNGWHKLSFDGKIGEGIKDEETPWAIRAKKRYFNNTVFLQKHPEYSECRKPYYVNDSGEDFIVQCYKRDEFSVDIWSNKGSYICTLPKRSRIERVFPSGLYAIEQYIDDDYLAFGITDKYGNILIPCQYEKHHRRKPESCPFDEVDPGVFSISGEYLEPFIDAFSGNRYMQVTPNYLLAKSNQNKNDRYRDVIAKGNKKLLFEHLSSLGGGITELADGWSQFSNPTIHHEGKMTFTDEWRTLLFNGLSSFHLIENEYVYDNHDTWGYLPDPNNQYKNQTPYFISEGRIITKKFSSHGTITWEKLESITIYDYIGSLIKKINPRDTPIIIKQPYRHGKAVSCMWSKEAIQLGYLDMDGNFHTIPIKMIIEDIFFEAYMVSEESIVINIKKPDYHCALINLNGKILFKGALWIDTLTDYFLSYYQKGKGYGIIDINGNVIVNAKQSGYDKIDVL